MFSVIVSILALVSGLGSLMTVLIYIRRNRIGHAAIMDYIDKKDESFYAAVDEANERGLKELEKIHLEQKRLSSRIEEVASDITPNLEAAKAAIAQVNDMGVGLANLFNYDPVEALRASRREGRGE